MMHFFYTIYTVLNYNTYKTETHFIHPKCLMFKIIGYSEQKWEWSVSTVKGNTGGPYILLDSFEEAYDKALEYAETR